MVAVQPEGDTVVFTIEGLHKLWALRSELRIPRAYQKRPPRPRSRAGLGLPGAGHAPSGPAESGHVLFIWYDRQ